MNRSTYRSVAAALATTAALVVSAAGSAAAAAPGQHTAASGQHAASPASAADICRLKGPFPADPDPLWKEGPSLHVDEAILGEDIMWYQIRWTGGTWSDVYWAGQNDIDWVDPNRRVWSYFFDHEHQYLSCPLL